LAATARKTNYDYTKGGLNDLIDIIIEEGAKLFVCAVGVPPKEVVEKLHKHNILCMNVSSSLSPVVVLSDILIDGRSA
jgi:NAD(P)H-dependent flavin oxidoreductase YrpB (nitropropane dioxygenase family)